MVSKMAFNHIDVDKQIKEIKDLGNVLMNYNFPQKSKRDEETLNVLKTSNMCTDGYDVVIHYNKSFYNKFYLESLQVLGRYTLFLPFCLVCKIAQKFLGNQHLSFIETFNEDRRVYCWTLLTDKEFNAIPASNKDVVENCVYEGFEYTQMNPKHVSFY